MPREYFVKYGERKNVYPIGDLEVGDFFVFPRSIVPAIRSCIYRQVEKRTPELLNRPGQREFPVIKFEIEKGPDANTCICRRTL
jgi:hypothetical protein